MASLITHLSIALLYFIQPGVYDLPILVFCALFPDTEYLFYFIGNLMQGKKFIKAYADTSIGPLHSLLFGVVLAIPVLTFVFYILGFGSLSVIFNSVAVGVVSHFLLDIPAHSTLRLFWPWKTLDPNPFLIFRKEYKMLHPFYNRWPTTANHKYRVSCLNYMAVSHIVAAVMVILLFV